jgi:arylsulfatase A-like enzyme
VPPHSGQDNSARATVDLNMTTIADKLRSAGYATGMSGKWHAGHEIIKQTPHGRGFQTSLGYMNGACDHYTQTDGEDGCGSNTAGHSTDIWNTDQPGFGLNGTYGDFMYVGRAVETILAHDASVPLFYYLAMQCAHEPMEAPQRYKDLYDAKTTPSVVEYAFSSIIDEAIGNVTAALRTKKMWKSTLMAGWPAIEHATFTSRAKSGRAWLNVCARWFHLTTAAQHSRTRPRRQTSRSVEGNTPTLKAKP